MKLLFCCDHRFEVSADGEVFTLGGKFPYEGWSEYLAVFDQIIVLGRGAPLESPLGRLSRSSGSSVKHVLLGQQRGAKRLPELVGLRAKVRPHVLEADAVIVRLPSELGLAAAAEARALKKPHLADVVASAWDGLWHHSSLLARAYAPVLEARTKNSVRRAPVARYVTQSFLQGKYPPMGTSCAVSDVRIVPLDAQSLEARLAEWPTGGRLVFGTIGSLVSRMKGVHVALRSLASVLPNLPPFTYRILGEGDPRPYQEISAALGLGDRVQFDGVLPAGDAVARWLDLVDIYLQPSFQEGLPRALIEAMSRGCLVLASSAGGIPELLPPQRLHTPGDASTLAQQLMHLTCLQPEALREERRANWTVAKRYSRELIEAKRVRSLEGLRNLAAANRL